MAADFEGSDNVDDVEFGVYTNMFGLGGNDQLGSSAIFARIYGGADSDQLFYTGIGNSELYGDAGNDQIFGGSQNDKFFGGGGGDWMFGDTGKNVFKTGGGRDHVVFDAAPDDQLDKAPDFNPSKDYLNFYATLYPVGVAGAILSKSQFRKGAKAKDEDDNFGYNKKNGIVWYDENGSDAGGFHKMVKLDEGLNLTHLNFQF